MKLRWNWGTGIALTYSAFVIIIIGFVISSSRKQIDLVAPDYYARELAFQGQLDKLSRTKALAEPLRWKLSDQSVQLEFPAAFAGRDISGTVHFFCPANARFDREESIAVDSSLRQFIATDHYPAGRYRMQVDWKAEGLDYYEEAIVSINNEH